MAEPIKIDFPHSLGKLAARKKLESGFEKLAGFVPGGRIVSHRWAEDSLFFVIETLGQRASVRLDTLESAVHAEVDLPLALALFAGKLRSALTDAGTRLLK